MILIPSRVFGPFKLLACEQHIGPSLPGRLHEEILGILPPSEVELQELQFLPLKLRSSSRNSSWPSVSWCRISSRRSSCQGCHSPGTHGGCRSFFALRLVFWCVSQRRRTWSLKDPQFLHGGVRFHFFLDFHDRFPRGAYGC